MKKYIIPAAVSAACALLMGAALATSPSSSDILAADLAAVAVAAAPNIVTDADCEHAERVLTAYAVELAEQGKSEREIRAALRELAAEY